MRQPQCQCADDGPGARTAIPFELFLMRRRERRHDSRVKAYSMTLHFERFITILASPPASV